MIYLNSLWNILDFIFECKFRILLGRLGRQAIDIFELVPSCGQIVGLSDRIFLLEIHRYPP